MIDDLVLTTRSVEKNKASITSVAHPFLQPPEHSLSPHAQPKWFLTALPIHRLEARPHERPNGSQNNASRPFLFRPLPTDLPHSIPCSYVRTLHQIKISAQHKASTLFCRNNGVPQSPFHKGRTS